MNNQLMNILLSLAGLALGAGIGLAFGSIQHAAALRHEKLQHNGGLTSGWAIMPGSMRRIAFLVMALVVVQIACPMLFEAESARWLVSVGVVLGYGRTLLQQIRGRTA